MPDSNPVDYAASTDGYVAYRAIGSGPDVLLINDWFSHIGDIWRPDSPFLPVLNRLSSYARLIMFDKRGVGMSDPLAVPMLPTMEKWADDVSAVLDAAGADQVSIVGKGSGGTMAVLFAALHPERVSSLVLVNAWARLSWAPDFPLGIREADQEVMLRTPYMPPASVDAVAGEPLSPAVQDWYQRYVRTAASPSTVIAMRRWLFSVDVRSALSAVSAPTRVVAFSDAWIGKNHGRYLAERIPDAELVTLPGGTDLLFAGDPDVVGDEIEEFVTGSRVAKPADRVLATVLYTDLVDSTALASRLGDRRWRSLLDLHDEVVRASLEKWSGHEVKHTGDGFLATFDGPARAIRCAEAVRERLRPLGLEVRAGLHAGEIELRAGDIGGISVHIGSRVAALAASGEILVSRTVRDLVAGSGIVFIDRGVHRLKGIDDDWQLYSVQG
jgi:class 3 adenylate cyclase